MKVQIDDTVVVQSQFGNLLDEGFLKLQQVDGTETVRVSGHGCSLRKDIQPGKETQTGVKRMIPHVGIAFDAQ